VQRRDEPHERRPPHQHVALCLVARAWQVDGDGVQRLNVTQRSLSVTQRSLSVNQRSLSVTQRALSVTQRALSVTQRGLSVTQRALSVTQRALSVTQRALSVTQRALSVTQRALSLTPTSWMLRSHTENASPSARVLLFSTCKVYGVRVRAAELFAIAQRPGACINCVGCRDVASRRSWVRKYAYDPCQLALHGIAGPTQL
jgi:hypothetical protein